MYNSTPSLVLVSAARKLKIWDVQRQDNIILPWRMKDEVSWERKDEGSGERKPKFFLASDISDGKRNAKPALAEKDDIFGGKISFFTESQERALTTNLDLRGR